MRRTTPLALLLAAVFLTVAASATFTPLPPGGIAPNVVPLWGAGILSVLVFVESESRWLRERIPFLRSHRSRLRRLIERGQIFKLQVGQLSSDAGGRKQLPRELGAALRKWAADCDTFATDLDEPTFSFQLVDLRPDTGGLVSFTSLEFFVDERLRRLGTLDDAAHKADRG